MLQLFMHLYRYGIFSSFLDRIENHCGGLDHFTRSYEAFGMVVQPDNSVRCREWAPGADGLFLIGDFSMILVFEANIVSISV